MLCRRCYRGPTATCSSCGRERPCDRVKTGKPICQPCAGKQRTKQICSECGNLRLVHVRTDAGQPVCNPCARKREPCSRCGNTRAVVARLDIGPLCARCLEAEPAYFVDCVRCGRHRRAYHHGMCNDCACPGVLAKLFCGDGEPGYAAKQIIDALLQSESAAVLRWAERTELRRGVVRGIHDLGDRLDHAALDELPPGKSVEWLRNILISARVLPDRDRFLRRTEMFIRSRVEGIDNPDDRATVRSFMEWHHLRKLRAQAARGPLRSWISRPNGGKRNRCVPIWSQQLRTQSCNVYTSRGRRLARRQSHPTSHQPVPAVGYETTPCARRRCPQPARPANASHPRQRRRRTVGADSKADRRRRPRHSGPRSGFTSTPLQNGCCTITLGTVPLNVTEPVAALLSDPVAHRRGYAAVDIGVNPWLFPGGQTGQHLSAQQMGSVLGVLESRRNSHATPP